MCFDQHTNGGFASIIPFLLSSAFQKEKDFQSHALRIKVIDFQTIDWSIAHDELVRWFHIHFYFTVFPSVINTFEPFSQERPAHNIYDRDNV